jgi:hypothetical protein
VFVQYGYLHARVVVYSPIRGWSRFNLQRYLQATSARSTSNA